MPIIGIDLGTTNSLVSYWSESGVKIIPNALGSNLTPSIVSVDDNGEVFVGQVAKERLITNPDKTVASFKRYMGTTKTFQLGKHRFLPEELSALVIRSLKQAAEDYLQESVSEAVISVPAYFNDTQRKATKRAGELAGLKVERLINEPTAAAVAYGMHNQEDETKFLIFDLGGGTFDVSIVELFDSIMEVKAIAGDNYLGGNDFSDLLVELFLQQNDLKKEKLNSKEYSLVRKQADICKQALSINNYGTMSCTIKDKNIKWEISRDDFANKAKDLINKLRHPVERALSDSGIKADELANIILVGGATRMSLVHNMVSKLFGRFPSCYLNPDEVVALGAGIQAGMKAREVALKEIVLTDVCPYTLGVETVHKLKSTYEDGHFFPIIERNSVIPISRVESLATIVDNQKIMHINVFQGESRLTKNNIKLGELEIDIPPAPAGESIVDVRYTYDINGILEVEALAVQTGIKKRLVLQGNSNDMSQEELDRRLVALSHIKIHPKDRQENQLLIARSERLYEESLGDVRLAINMALNDFESALSTQDEHIIKKAAKELEEKLDAIENEKMF